MNTPDTPDADGIWPPCGLKPTNGYLSCQSFLQNGRTGGCKSPGRQSLCTEWTNERRLAAIAEDGKRHLPAISPGRDATAAPQEGTKAASAAPPPQPDRPAFSAAPHEAPEAEREYVQLGGGFRFTISPGDLRDLERFGQEVRIEDPQLGSLWLVPRLTGKQRQEMTFAQAALLRALLDVFPGAQVREIYLEKP